MTEIQADPRRCGKLIKRAMMGVPRNVYCDGIMDAIERTKGGAFTVYKCRTCGCEVVMDRFNVEVK